MSRAAKVIPLPVGRMSRRRRARRMVAARRQIEPALIEPRIEALAPAAMTAKAAAFDVLEAVDRTVGDPARGIRRLLGALTATPFSSPRVEAKAAKLIAEHGERARLRLRAWDYPGVKHELQRLCDRLERLDPAIIEHLLRNAGVAGAAQRDTEQRPERAS